MSFVEKKISVKSSIDSFLFSYLDSSHVQSRRLKEAMHYALLNGGKRMRPLLLHTVGEMLGVEEGDLVVMAAAVECIHAYSLSHDDLPAMDDDDVRRGKPTTHKAFDEATAILAGDALQTLAFDITVNSPLSDFASSKRCEAVRILVNASGASGMCAGQSLDLISTNMPIPLETLITLHQLKTGALLKACVLLASLLSRNITAKDREHLIQFANAIGLAFQVQDDILDVTSDSETLGKPQGADEALNKSTFPAQLGLANAQQYLLDLQQEALNALAALPYDTSALVAFTDYLVKRNH